MNALKISNEQLQQIQQAHGVKSKNKVGGVSQTGAVQKADAVSVSLAGKDIQKALQALSAMPEPVRTDLVEGLKQRIADGSYRPDAGSITDGLLNPRE
ncbi:MAG TPA: flagellar biosynthesis anti-sigma factor FlgM [Chroococcales cyanobacterium]